MRDGQRAWAMPAMWIAITGLAVYYLFHGIVYRFAAPGLLGPTLLHRQLWFSLHLAFAAPVLLGGPLQFWPGLRTARPRLHRLLGKVYVVGATVAALAAIVLGATIEYEGARLPLILVSSLWLFFTMAAWRRAVARDFPGHRTFMIRSYNIALIFIWQRLIQEGPRDAFLFFIADGSIRDVTIEWVILLGPVLAMEMYLSWVPQARGRRA